MTRKSQGKNESGFGHLGLVLGVVVLAALGFVGWYVFSKQQVAKPQTNSTTQQKTAATSWPMTDQVRWEGTSEGGWMAISGTPPACPNPLQFKLPADISKATALLYPGQERRGNFEGQGGNYKPHGGFRFDNSKYNEITVSSPFDGYVYRGSKFLQEGEIQYAFDIVNPCGIMIRLGHLRELSPAFQAIADKFPAPRELDSRTERVVPMVKVETGDPIATAVGFKNAAGNTFFDWGVYDMRQANAASKSTAYQQAHADAKELAYYAVCWLDMLSSADETAVRALPAADPVSGKTSDYCK